MVVLKITNAGLNAALDAQNNGLTLRLSTIMFGAGKYIVNDNDPRTAMESPFLTAAFVGGGVEPNSHTLRFNCTFKDNQAREVYEIGLFTDEGELFAVTSTTGEAFLSTSKTLTTVFIGGMKLGAFNSSSVQVVLDENGALALQIFGAHEAHPNPHPQYAMNTDLEDLSEQVENLFVRKTQIVDHLDSESSTDVLSARMGNKLKRDAAWRVFFGQVSSSIIDSDNSNTFIRLLDGNLKPMGGSTRVFGEGNIQISAIAGVLKILGKLNNTLTSTAIDEALTALQGKILNEKLDTVTTFVWNNVLDLLNNKYDKSGGPINGNATVNGSLKTSIGLTIGDTRANNERGSEYIDAYVRDNFEHGKEATFVTGLNKFRFLGPVYFGDSTISAEWGVTSLPNGMIMMWGIVADDFVDRSFPTSFPNRCCSLVAQQIQGGGSSKVFVRIINKSTFRVGEGDSPTGNTYFYWQAIGY